MTSINAMISSAYFHLKAQYEQCKILFYYSNLVALHIADMDSVKQGNDFIFDKIFWIAGLLLKNLSILTAYFHFLISFLSE